MPLSGIERGQWHEKITAAAQKKFSRDQGRCQSGDALKRRPPLKLQPAAKKSQSQKQKIADEQTQQQTQRQVFGHQPLGHAEEPAFQHKGRKAKGDQAAKRPLVRSRGGLERDGFPASEFEIECQAGRHQNHGDRKPIAPPVDVEYEIPKPIMEFTSSIQNRMQGFCTATDPNVP
jgi:hypothetical protein